MAGNRFDIKEIFKHTLYSIVIGFVGAGASILLCICVDWCYDVMQAHHWLVFLLPIFALLSLVLYKVFKIPFDMTTRKLARYMREDKEIPATLAPGILIATCLSTLGGASVGKEAGALHMGASLGTLVSKPFHLKTTRYEDEELKQEHQEGAFSRFIDDMSPLVDADPRAMFHEVLTLGEKAAGNLVDAVETVQQDSKAKDVRDRGMRTYTAACGMAATFSALFFSPLGSAMFVLELNEFKLSVRKHVVSILIGCYIGAIIANFVGIGDIIPKPDIPPISWHMIGNSIVIGVVSSVFGIIYVTVMRGIQNVTRLRSSKYPLWLIIGSVSTVVLLYVFDWFSYAGSGAPLIAVAMAGHENPWGFAIKILLTTIALGFWIKGGEIMPTFVAGSLLGASCCFLTGADPGISAAIGMVAFFAAMSRCPLAAILMGCEIFGWNGILFFAIAVVISNAVGRHFGMYGHGFTTAMKRFSQDMRKNIITTIDTVKPTTKTSDEASQSDLESMQQAAKKVQEVTAEAINKTENIQAPTENKAPKHRGKPKSGG